MTESAKPKWTTVDSTAAMQLTLSTNSPGVVYPVASTAIPHQLQGIPGVSSFYVSGYVTPQPLSNGVTVGGEFVVARSDGALTKNYNFVFGTSSDGTVRYNGPYKGFGHHVSSGQSVDVNSLFGQTPFSTK